jgi:taurine dioxygenase
MAGLQLHALTGALGVEVWGISLANLTESDVPEIHGLVDRYGVVIFPSQDLDADQHLALAHMLGSPQIHAYHAAEGPHPELLVMRSTKALADFWHSDETYEDRPPDLAVLRVVECPSVGGDTLWVNQYLTFESLSPTIQAAVASLQARHATPDGDAGAEHPMTYRHPTSGRQALYVNQQFTRRILGVSEAESEALLGLLFATANNPDFQCRYRWSAGAIAIWDNCTTLHRVAADYRDMRHTERIALIVRAAPDGAVNGA